MWSNIGNTRLIVWDRCIYVTHSYLSILRADEHTQTQACEVNLVFYATRRTVWLRASHAMYWSLAQNTIETESRWTVREKKNISAVSKIGDVALTVLRQLSDDGRRNCKFYDLRCDYFASSHFIGVTPRNSRRVYHHPLIERRRVLRKRAHVKELDMVNTSRFLRSGNFTRCSPELHTKAATRRLCSECVLTIPLRTREVLMRVIYFSRISHLIKIIPLNHDSNAKLYFRRSRWIRSPATSCVSKFSRTCHF